MENMGKGSDMSASDMTAKCAICKNILEPLEAKRKSIFLSEEDIYSGNYQNKFDTIIYFCPNCFSFHNLEAYKIDLDRQKYGSESFYSYDQSMIINNYKSYLACLGNLFSLVNADPGGKDFLDIGCGLGTSLYAARKLSCKRAVGVDIASSNYSIACSELKKYFNNWRPEFFTSLKEVVGQFDFILLWHVLEHINKPIDFFHEISGKLRKDGFIFIQVPQYVEKYICDTHVIFYTIPSLKYLCRMHELNLVCYANDAENQFSTFIIKK